MSASKSTRKVNIILIFLILLLLVIIFTLLTFNNVNKVVISSESISKNNIINSNTLTMMYETEADSGEYQVSSDTTWPEDGYIFNSELSSCENGSKITWDDEKKKVVMQANTSDKCYVYFDKKPAIEIINATGHAGEVSVGIDSVSINSINPIKIYYVKFINLTTNEESEVISFTEIPYRYYSYYGIILPCVSPDENVIAELYVEDIYGNISNVYEFSLNTSGMWLCPKEI